MTAVIYYIPFRENDWWKFSIKFKTNKVKPFKLREFPKFRNPIMALFDYNQRGSTWLQITGATYGITLGIIHQSHIYPYGSKPLYIFKEK